MKKHAIIFLINSTGQIVIPLENDLKNVSYCDEEFIFFVAGSKRLILANMSIYYAMERFSNLLDKALNNQLLIHGSIKNDIGYLYNEYSYNKLLKNSSMFINVTSDEKSFWVGYEYYLWSSCFKNSSSVTWIYNDFDGAIILEITPLYVDLDPIEELNYIPYERWIKDYKPCLIKKISKDIARQWLEQARGVVECIDKNIALWEQE